MSVFLHMTEIHVYDFSSGVASLMDQTLSHHFTLGKASENNPLFVYRLADTFFATVWSVDVIL